MVTIKTCKRKAVPGHFQYDWFSKSSENIIVPFSPVINLNMVFQTLAVHPRISFFLCTLTVLCRGINQSWAGSALWELWNLKRMLGLTAVVDSLTVWRRWQSVTFITISDAIKFIKSFHLLYMDANKFTCQGTLSQPLSVNHDSSWATDVIYTVGHPCVFQQMFINSHSLRESNIFSSSITTEWNSVVIKVFNRSEVTELFASIFYRNMVHSNWSMSFLIMTSPVCMFVAFWACCNAVELKSVEPCVVISSVYHYYY